MKYKNKIIYIKIGINTVIQYNYELWFHFTLKQLFQ